MINDINNNDILGAGGQGPEGAGKRASRSWNLR